MSKAIIVVDFAYKSPTRKGYGSGRTGLSSTLKYLQYRDKIQNQLAQNHDYERWQNRGMGLHWRDILSNSEQLKSQHVLAWTWIVSPSPELMALVPEVDRRDLLCDLTEKIVEDYYAERDFDLPEYSYILHDRPTDDEGLQQLHTHVVLPGTVSSISERQAVYNNKERGHDALFRDVASYHFETMLDEMIGPEWRLKRDELDQEHTQNLDPHDLDAWFGTN